MKFLKKIFNNCKRNKKNNDVVSCNLAYASSLQQQVQKDKKNYLYIDWPFGNYVFDEMEKANYENINLIKFSQLEFLNLENRSALKRISDQKSKEAEEAYLSLFKQLNIDGVLFTHDWHVSFRVLIEALKKEGIKTICIVHEGVFQNENLFYDSQKPICDLVLCWGELHKKIFTSRGYDEDKIFAVGSIKLNGYKKFKPTISKNEMFNKLNLDINNKTILYCCQLCDNQWGDQDNALKEQRRLIKDLIDISQENNYNLIVRNAPAQPRFILPDDFMKQFNGIKNVVFEGQDLSNMAKSSYLTKSSDNLYYSDIIVGMNTTMQIEGTLLHKPAIVAAYFDFDPKWHHELGLPICYNFEQLQDTINKFIDNKSGLIQEEKRNSFYKDYGFEEDLGYDPIKNIEEFISK